MPRFVAAVFASGASAHLLRVNTNSSDFPSKHFQTGGNQRFNGNYLHVSGAGGISYGDVHCPCVGFDNILGSTEVTIGGRQVDYPADLGARCSAWDDDRNPDHCKGPNPAAWCSQKWCYVDPCNCDLPVLPKISAYLPNSQFQGKPVYYSYATCGGTDHFTSEHHADACVNQQTKGDCSNNGKCLWNEAAGKCGGAEVMGACMKPLPAKKWGKDSCKCVGIDSQPGVTRVQIGDDQHDSASYPADTGASCFAWDKNNHPKCKAGGDSPSWCFDAWCYVDPCSCDLSDAPPKTSFYLPSATYQGRPVFYSYATCGTKDQYSSKDLKTAAKEQTAVCSSAWAAVPAVAMILTLASV